MAKKLDFKDFLTVDYAPGMPDLIKKNAKRRKGDTGAGTNAEYSSTHSPEEKIDTIGEQKGDPIALGTHAKNVGMGYTGKHTTIKDPGSKKGRHTHVFQFTGEESELDEAMTAAHKKLAYDVHKQLKRDQSMSPGAGFKLKADHNMLRSKYGSDWRKKAGINEETQLDEVSQELGRKVAKARQSQASDLRQKAVDEPDMMKAFAHTKAANKAEKKAGQSYNRLMKKEEVEEVDEALTLQQRRARGRKMKLKRRQIEVGRKRALKRAADPKRLKSRAEKAARNAIFRRLAKGKSRSEVPAQRKQEIERRMEKMKSRIQRLAIKLVPKVRQLDKERRASKQNDDK